MLHDEQLSMCIHKLIESKIFKSNKAYVRRKLISILIRSINPYQSSGENISQQLQINIDIIVGAFLLIDGRSHTSTLEMMLEESTISRIITIIWNNQQENKNVILIRIYLDLLFEMCKIQKLTKGDLNSIQEEFVEQLFFAVERRDDYDHDPYGYTVLKVLLALNEQYMIASVEQHKVLDTDEKNPSTKPTDFTKNKIFHTLVSNRKKFSSFGESIVFLLNRGPDNCVQLMVLKFLYQIFTTPETYDYLYLNDLKVIVDVFIRELNDLSLDEEKLLHTYLRVLHPLLTYSDWKSECYKRSQIIKVLEHLSFKSRVCLSELDDTTIRLADRCLNVPTLHLSKSRSLRRIQSDDNISTGAYNHTTLDAKYRENTCIPSKEDPSTSLPITPISSISSLPSSINIKDGISNSISNLPPPPPPPPPRSRAVPANSQRPGGLETNRSYHTPPPLPRPRKHILNLPHLRKVRSTSAEDVATFKFTNRESLNNGKHSISSESSSDDESESGSDDETEIEQGKNTIEVSVERKPPPLPPRHRHDV